jgi:DNA-binding ferritin-like protein
LRAVSVGTSLKAWPEKAVSGREHVEALANAIAQFGKATRAAIKEADDLDDEVTADLFNDITATTDKDLWFVEALFAIGPLISVSFNKPKLVSMMRRD